MAMPTPDAPVTPDMMMMVPDAPVVPDMMITPDAPVTPDMMMMTPDAPVVPDMMVTPDAPVPDTMPVPDAPVDTTPLPPPGCADQSREAFMNAGAFPDVAACGKANDSGFSFPEAVAASGVCTPGWHWCKAGDVGALPTTIPERKAGVTCAWLDARNANCNDTFTSFDSSGCQLPMAATGYAGGTSNGVCVGLQLCLLAWKLAMPLDNWLGTSVQGAAGCHDHVTLQCANSLPTPTTCLMACCRD
jgi:hypothetical protein